MARSPVAPKITSASTWPAATGAPFASTLRRTGFPEAADEALRVLPDPVDEDQIAVFLAPRSITLDELVKPHGRHPWRPDRTSFEAGQDTRSASTTFVRAGRLPAEGGSCVQAFACGSSQPGSPGHDSCRTGQLTWVAGRQRSHIARPASLPAQARPRPLRWAMAVWRQGPAHRG